MLTHLTATEYPPQPSVLYSPTHRSGLVCNQLFPDGFAGLAACRAIRRQQVDDLGHGITGCRLELFVYVCICILCDRLIKVISQQLFISYPIHEPQGILDQYVLFVTCDICL